MEIFGSDKQFTSPERQEGRELETKEKENLIDAWLAIAVDNQEKPDNIENLSNQQLREWLYRTLIDDTAKLVEEWNLQPNNDLVERIQNEQNSEQRAKLEMDYIEAVRAKIQKFKRDNPLGERSSKWDSWPSEMRENRAFNCVGGTLLGISLLDRTGARSYYGEPFSHVLNIVELSNGEWVYADFLNNRVKKVKPTEITMLGGVQTLKLEDTDINYRYIPLLGNSEVAGSIIGNLDSLRHDIKDESVNPIDKQEAERLFNNFTEEFEKNDFSSLRDTLYPSRVVLRQTKEMQEERDRIEEIRSSSSPRKHIDTLDL